MRNLHARLEDTEIEKRHTISARDLSDSESEIEAEQEEEVVAEDATNEHLIRAISKWVQERKWTFQFMREIWMQRSF
jgi:hypothetical protein